MHSAVRVRDAMTSSNLVTVRADASIRELRAIFARYDVDVVPVLERDPHGGMRRLQGIASRAELLQFLLGAKSAKGLEKRQAQPVTAIARNIAPLYAEMPLASAATQLLAERIEALPVVSEDGRILGMLSLDDVLERAQAGFALSL